MFKNKKPNKLKKISKNREDSNKLTHLIKWTFMKSYKGKPENKHSSQVNMDHSPKEIIYEDIKLTYVFQRLLFIHDIRSDHSRNKSVDNDK